ncbi:hypothetical protein [Paenibacillus sp. 1P07SE]|uniref:hypothetical protein n=1 Tax=Paenibacillus sp. 1P07SE TaxID=3132209 RepID=UPI0039A58AC2
MSKTKTGLFILALSVMLVGAGCGNNANNNAPADTIPPSDVTQNNDPVLNDPAIDEDPLTDDPADDPLTDDEVVDPDAPVEEEVTTP